MITELLTAALLTIQVDPHVALAPSDIRIIIHVEVNESNAYVIINCDGPGYYRSSAIPIRTNVGQMDPVWYRDLPAGEYIIEVSLYRESIQGSHEVARVKDRVILTGDDK